MEDMDYISYSQYNTFSSCPRSWYLSKVRQAEEKQTWYLPIGTAVHNMIEDYIEEEYESDDQLRPEAYLYPLIERQMEIEPDLSKWLASGPKEAPLTHERAVQHVRNCFSAALEELEQIDVWEVEYDASGRLPGLSVPVRAYVDLVGEHKKKGPVIIDWKTGSSKPGNFQLETYAALLGGTWDGTQVLWSGRYVMLAPGTPNTRYVDLSKVDPREVAAKYQAVYDRMQAQEYAAKQGFDCKFCLQAPNCLANAGMTQRALYYDRSEEDGIPY